MLHEIGQNAQKIIPKKSALRQHFRIFVPRQRTDFRLSDLPGGGMPGGRSSLFVGGQSGRIDRHDGVGQNIALLRDEH